MKFAILYAGPYRATNEIVQNHMDTFGKDNDVYVSCFEHYLDEWKSSNFNVTEYFNTPTINFNQTDWAKYRNNPAGESGFWQFWNLRNVIQCVPKKYDFYIKNRNDLIFDNSINLKSLDLQKNTIYSPESSFHRKSWDLTSWINDEFYIGCENSMNVISNFVTDYYSGVSRHSPNIPLASNESQLRIHLAENKIDVKIIKNLKYKKDHYGNELPSGYVRFQLEK